MQERLKFTVDSKLLEELGERLVGKPSTALAELVKNAYDADATIVDIILDRSGEGLIRVEDNGHGMTFEEFRAYWMRLGSQHKREKRKSRNFGRPFTGSKGVGRVAAQLLSHKLTLISVSEHDTSTRLIASLDWREAIETGDLIDVEVHVRQEQLKNSASPGTVLVLRDLRQDWSEDEIEGLAQEIWQLQPPFGDAVPRDAASATDFKVRFGGPEEDLVEVFDEQIQAILRLWNAKAVGENDDGQATIALQFKGEEPSTFRFEIDDCELQNGHFELRFYELKGRQPHGIRVSTARKYLREFGGVHIYDTGFRLPFYGEKDNDWLLISHDMSRRKTLSGLLPEEMQVKRGLLSLPQWYQVLGTVTINTSQEPGLEITITRDRLVESTAFDQLRDFVRSAIHWYANEKARRRLEEEEKAGDGREAVQTVEGIVKYVDAHRDRIPEEVADELASRVVQAREEIEEREASAERRIGALSSFATAGISAIGYQHELTKQLLAIEDLTNQLGELLENPAGSTEQLSAIRERLLQWVSRARKTGRIFSHLSEPENLEKVKRFRLRALLEEVVDQIEPIRREAEVDLSAIDEGFRLPSGSYTEWISVFQNAFFNALNAMVDAEEKLIRVRTQVSDGKRRIIIEDTGIGVDLNQAPRLFDPLVRKTPISRERRELGFGGSGLGLTIIRMIAREQGVEVSFEEPAEGFSTALVLQWEEEAQ